MATGRFFDGVSAQDRPVLLTLERDALVALDPVDGRLWCWPFRDLRRADPDAPGPEITLSCAGEVGRLLVSDAAILAELHRQNPRLRGVRRWTGRNWLAVTISLVLAVTGLPLLVDRAPGLLLPLVPASLDHRWSDTTQAVLGLEGDRCLGSAGQAALGRLAATLARAAELKAAPPVTVWDNAQVNAFTLPDGRILVMRGLIEHVADADEFAGVIGHELGHVRYHDPTREMLRRLELSMLSHALGWSSDLGSQMAVLSYGRRAETRADLSAVATLRRAGLRADGLARFLRSLQVGREPAALAFLSDHPTDAARVARLPQDTAGQPAMTSQDWMAVRRICDKP